MAKTYDADLNGLRPDPHNANSGTSRGRALLSKSISEVGAGRSILVDRNGTTIAGAKTLQALVESGMTNAIIVETDGTRPVVVKRTDLDLSDKKGAARRMAYLDNRVAEIDLEWDAEVIAADLAGGVNIGDLWTADELARVIGIEAGAGEGEGTGDACDACGKKR